MGKKLDSIQSAFFSVLWPKVRDFFRKLFGLEEENIFEFRKMSVRLSVAIAAYLLCLFAFIYFLEISVSSFHTAIWYFIPHIILMAFAFQAMDSTMGMGFGTAIAPLLIVMGYEPLAVVPMLLLVQAFSGLLAGWLHHDIGNVALSFKPLSTDTKALLLATGIGIISTIISIYIVYWAIQLPAGLIETYIAITVIAMGIIVLLKPRSRWRKTFHGDRFLFFSLIAGINKGIAGGGYGPFITLGAIYSGIREKSAVAIITLAEGMVSLAGAATFLILVWEGKDFNFDLLPSVLTGSFLAAVISPFLVWLIPPDKYKFVVPSYTILIGMFILIKIYIFNFL